MKMYRNSKILILLVLLSSFIIKNNNKNVILKTIDVRFKSLPNKNYVVLSSNDIKACKRINPYNLFLIDGNKTCDLSDIDTIDDSKYIIKNISDSAFLMLKVSNKQYVIKYFTKYVCDEGEVRLRFFIDTLAAKENFFIYGNFYGGDRMCSAGIEDTLHPYSVLEFDDESIEYRVDGIRIPASEYFRKHGISGKYCP